MYNSIMFSTTFNVISRKFGLLFGQRRRVGAWGGGRMESEVEEVTTRAPPQYGPSETSAMCRPGK